MLPPAFPGRFTRTRRKRNGGYTIAADGSSRDEYDRSLAKQFPDGIERIVQQIRAAISAIPESFGPSLEEMSNAHACGRTESNIDAIDGVEAAKGAGIVAVVSLLGFGELP
jgi:hypothetical protein